MLPHGRTMRALSALVGTCRASWAREASLGRRGIKNGPTSLTKFLRESYKRFNDQMFGETTIQERYDEFVKDLKFINADVTKYIDGFEPMRIDIGQKVNRFMKVHSDAEYGGLSNCSTEVRIGDRVVDRSDESEASYVRFKGELRFPVHEDAKVKTNGFCAAQAVCRRVLDLSDYEGFELILRSKDTRDYIFGLKTMSLAMLSDMQYQIKLEVPGGNEWTYFHIPWSYFRLVNIASCWGAVVNFHLMPVQSYARGKTVRDTAG